MEKVKEILINALTESKLRLQDGDIDGIGRGLCANIVRFIHAQLEVGHWGNNRISHDIFEEFKERMFNPKYLAGLGVDSFKPFYRPGETLSKEDLIESVDPSRFYWWPLGYSKERIEVCDILIYRLSNPSFHYNSIYEDRIYRDLFGNLSVLNNNGL